MSLSLQSNTVPKIYIAGPMTGYEKFNFPAFDTARNSFISKGFEVFSPADHDRQLLGKNNDWMPGEIDSIGPWKMWAVKNAPTLRQMLGDDLQYICSTATHVYMLRGWEKSLGARAEHAAAVTLGLEVIYAN